MPRLRRVWILWALGLVSGAGVAFFGHPVVVGANLRRAGDAAAGVLLAAVICSVAGLVLGVGLDARAMRRQGRPVGAGAAWLWATLVLLFAVAAFPVYLYLRAAAVRERDPSNSSTAAQPVLGAVVGLVAVVASSVVVIAAAVAAVPVFGVAIDPATVEQDIAQRTTGNVLVPITGLTNVTCRVPGLLQPGESFTCTQRPDEAVGIPSFTTTTTDRFGLPEVTSPSPTITYRVTVQDRAGTVVWQREG